MTDTLGRLTLFGVTTASDVWRLAPNRYIPLTDHVTHLADLPMTHDGVERTNAVISGYVNQAAMYDPIKKRTSLAVRIQDGTLVRIMAFGHPNNLPASWRRQATPIALAGKLIAKPDGFCMMYSPTPIDDDRIGTALGVYPSKSNLIGAETVRARIMEITANSQLLEEAVQMIASQLPGYSLEAVMGRWGEQNGYALMTAESLSNALRALHYPKSERQGNLAKRLLGDLSALSRLIHAENDRPKTENVQRVKNDPAKCETRLKALPFTATQEQRTAIQEMLDDMASGLPSHRVLSGDVGTGKSIVMLTIAAAVLDAGGKVALMLPSEDLVNQMVGDCQSWWPDIPIDTVTSSTDKHASLTAAFRIGTTALLARDTPEWAPTLTIVDEQQKYSAQQRQQLVTQGGHLLEATATCLPRTMAQMQFGLIPVSRLTQPHSPKAISTDIWDQRNREGLRHLFRDVKETLAAGDQVLVIFAARDQKDVKHLLEGDEAENNDTGLKGPAVLSLEEGIERWRELLGADMVVGLHGRMKSADRKKNLAALTSGTAQVLCATSAAEVGLNLPRLRHVVVQNPERFGLVTLHQIRGRSAREGGAGRCDIIADSASLSDKASSRIKAFVGTDDGFALAEIDMRERGIGSFEIEQSRQSGQSDESLLLGYRPTIENFEVAAAMLAKLGTPEVIAAPASEQGASHETHCHDTPSL